MVGAGGWAKSSPLGSKDSHPWVDRFVRARRHVWCPLSVLNALFYLLIAAFLAAPSSRRMPHPRSADRRLARHDRAARRGYVRSLLDVHGFVQVPAPLLPRARAQTLKDALRTDRRAAIARHEWACTSDDSDDNLFLAPTSGNPRARDACTQCDAAPGLQRPCVLVDLSDLTEGSPPSRSRSRTMMLSPPAARRYCCRRSSRSSWRSPSLRSTRPSLLPLGLWRSSWHPSWT